MQGQDLIEKSVKSSRQQKDDSTMIGEWNGHCASVRTGLNCCLETHFILKTHNTLCSSYLSKTHFVWDLLKERKLKIWNRTNSARHPQELTACCYQFFVTDIVGPAVFFVAGAVLLVHGWCHKAVARAVLCEMHVFCSCLFAACHCDLLFGACLPCMNFVAGTALLGAFSVSCFRLKSEIFRQCHPFRIVYVSMLRSFASCSPLVSGGTDQWRCSLARTARRARCQCNGQAEGSAAK